MNDVFARRAATVAAGLEYDIDVMAAFGAQKSGAAVLVDSRKTRSWEHGHITGAVHCPGASVREPGAVDVLPSDVTLIVYGWGPGCNGAAAMARELLDLGFDVRELFGGFEYWGRNGLPIEGVPSSPLCRTALNPTDPEVDGMVDLTQPADPWVTAEL